MNHKIIDVFTADGKKRVVAMNDGKYVASCTYGKIEKRMKVGGKLQTVRSHFPRGAAVEALEKFCESRGWAVAPEAPEWVR